MPWNPEYYQTKVWNTGTAAERARHNLKLKNKKKIKPQATSRKPQATSSKRLTK